MENKSKKYLSLVADETLEEHDRHYHGGSYIEGNPCVKRDAAASRGSTRKMSDDEKAALNARVRRVDLKGLSDIIREYDDNKHPEELEIIMKEVDRRDRASIESRMNALGERA